MKCFFVLIIFLPLYVLGQNTIGLPEIVNYPKQAYNGGAQTRQFAQDENGIMYFANNEGVLTFNGARWNTFALPNKSLVRSIEFGTDRKLYVGGQDEIGYLLPNAYGILKYHSLKRLVPKESRSFADIWEITVHKNSIFFQTSKEIFQLTEQKVTVFKDPHWLFMGNMGNDLVAQSADKGLLIYQSGLWIPVKPGIANALPKDVFITSLTDIGKDSSFLTTLKHGIYLITNGQAVKLQSPILQQLENKNISSSRKVNRDQVAIGTNLDGCIIIDKKGNFIRSFTKEEGLQNNSVLSIFLDTQHNLWLGLNNGIDFIPYNNAIKHIHPKLMNEGAVFTSHLFNKELYIGTSVGLFKVPVGSEKDLGNIKSSFSAIKNTEGEAWNLSEVNGKLLMGHNDGAFLVDGDKVTSLDKSKGYWNFQPYATTMPATVMVAGSYNGIEFFNYYNNRFTKAPLEANVESARFIVVNNNIVWFSHPYKGIYAVSLKDNKPVVKKYSAREGVNSDNNNYLFKIKSTLVLTTGNGIFEYDAVANSFKPSAFYNKHLPEFPVRYMKEDTQGNVWFVFEKKIGVLDVTGAVPQIIYFPELNNKFVAGFEHINPINPNNILIGGEKGFYHINYQQYKQLQYPIHVQVSSVSTINQKDSLLFGGFAEAGKAPSISHMFNSLHFEFASPMYGQLSNIEYSYYLQGFDKKWIPFNERSEKDYTNLPAGNYVFKVKSRNNLGNESGESEYAFTILPPWYRSTIAHIVYILIGILLLYWLYQYQKKKFKTQQRRHEEEQQKLQYLHQLEIDKAEKELVQLRNEKLEVELVNKNSELASASMHLVQKSDVLLKIKEQMTKLKNAPAAIDNDTDLKSILRTINDENRMEEQWQQFSLHFDAVHHNFLAALKKKFPILSPNDHKLCAYLKMNLSTKEISQLMNISVRGVEISRYRLRKKLEVPGKMNLSIFLENINEK